MKAMRLTLWATLVLSAVCRAQDDEPGWIRFSGDGQPALQMQDDAVAQLQGTVQFSVWTSHEPATPVAEAVTPQIQALADGLQDDPVQIFNYVHDHVRFVLYFGSKKGAQLTLLERSGNDFDQAALLVSLLRAAGCTNALGSDHGLAYRFGWVQAPYDDPNGHDYDLRHWWRLTLNNTNWITTATYLNDLRYRRGYPQAYALRDGNSFEFQHVWVALTLGGTNYDLDPSFKISEPVVGLSLTNLLGATRAGLSNAIVSAAGGTTTSDYVSGLNEASVRGQLTQYTTNLLSGLQSGAPNASVPQVLGGWQIQPATPADFHSGLRLTNDDLSGHDPVLVWGNEPTNLMSTLAVSFAGTNYQCYVPQLQGQRLALTYDSSGLAQLWQDDTPLAQHSTTSADTNVVLAITHPLGTWDTTNNLFIPNPGNPANQARTNSYQRVNATYALLYAFEPDWGWLRQRQNKLDGYLQQGLTNGSRQVVSETLNVMGLGWMLQTASAWDLLAAQLGILPQYYHRLGRMAQETGKGYYVDVYMQLDSEYPDGGDDAAHVPNYDTYFDLEAYFGSTLEHGIIEQLQGTNLVGASTVKVLQVANTNGQRIYLANSGNWSSVQSGLSGYSSGVLSQITSRFINPGYSVLLPANGANPVAGGGSWAGYGFAARLVINGQLSDSEMIISGGYSGGYVSDPTAAVDSGYIGGWGDVQPGYNSATPPSTPAPLGADPVDLADGTFQLESTDLAVGQAEPRGLSLTRYYNGARRSSSGGGLTGGWVHNYVLNAAMVAAPQAGLGATTPAQAAPMVAATAAAIALYNGANPDARNWTLTALVAKWGVDQLTKGGVSVTLGKDTLQFVLQPNGVYTPPANCTMSLVKTNGAYALQERHGRTFRFNGTGWVTNIADQYNQSLTLSYNASNWVSTAKDWKNRTFTFSYTGSPQHLTSVSDGTRTVAYGYSTAYSPQADLVSVTDAENQTSSYICDTNHQITATLDALSRVVVSNVYNTQGRLSTQYTQGDSAKNWRIYWSGWQTVVQDPAGGQQVSYFDDQCRLVGQQDPLTNLSHLFYDGQNHVVATVSPLGETNQSFYDSSQNLVLTIDPLGSSNQFGYDTQNNLIYSVDGRGNTSRFGHNAQFSLTGSTNGAGDWVSYSYNTDGTLQTRADSAGTSTYGYDSYGQLNSITYPGSLGSESCGNTSLGDLSSHTDGRGFVTSFYYNSRRQLTNSVAPTNLTVRIAYDAVGNPQSKTDPRGATTANFWSPTRHLTGTVFPSTPQGTPATTNLYDSRDWLRASLDPLQNATLLTNDLVGRLVAQTDPLLRTSRFGYDPDGRRTASTNAAQEATLQRWDGRGQMIQVTDPASHTVLRAYDPAGNQIALTNRNGKRWQFQFDAANRLTNTITPKGYSTKLAYNNRGLLQSVTKPSTQSATLGYDARGRQTSRADSVGTTSYQFDANNNLTNVAENGNANAWAYDAYNRVSSYQDASGNLIQYRYDANGNVTSLIYPGNRTVAYAYDSLNRLTNVTDWASRQTGLSYDLANRLTSITRPNGTVRQISYDAAGEVTNIVEKTTGGFPIAFFTLGWGNSGRVAWEFAAPLPATNTGPPSRTMTIDDDNRLLTCNGQSVAHDNDGNMTSGPLTNDTPVTYSYNARNQLTGAGGLTYAYDPAGNRTSLTSGTNAVQFVINPAAGLPQVLMRIRPGVTNYYIYGPGLLYEVTETAASTSTLTYHYDLRGSTIALTDANGNVTDRVQYSSYGVITLRGGTNDTPFLYNGRYGVMADSNGLLYMRARFYNPYICRFINPDPAGFAGGLNWYCYADGNPISQMDPFGLCAGGNTEGWGGATATWISRNVVDPLNSVSTSSTAGNFASYMAASLLAGLGDLLRLGQGTANATYNAQDGWDVAIGISQDVGRAAGLATIVGGAAAGVLGGIAAAEGTAPNLMYHYTTAPESSFANGLWESSSVTDKLYSDAAQASQELGIPVPNKVIPIQNTGQFIPNAPSTVQRSFRFTGGGSDFINPQPVPPSQVLPAQPVGPH